MSQVRIAVIGAGHLGRIHARLLKGLEGVELVAVVDPSESARQLIEQQLEVQTLSDYHTLSGQVDAVVIATPTSFHYKVATWSLRHRIHTFVEKPLVTSTVQAESLIALAEERDCVLQVGHVERFNPAWNAASPLISEPKYISATRAGVFTGRSTDIGVVFDLMIHDLDLMIQAVQSPVLHVDAIGLAVLGQFEDIAEARLHFQNGCVATIKASRIGQSSVREMQVYTATAMLNIDFGANSVEIIEPTQEVLSRRFQADLLPPQERLALKDELFTKWLPKRKLNIQPANAIEQELCDFAAAIRGEKEPYVTADHARQAIQIAEQILSSIQNHSWSESAHFSPSTGSLATPITSFTPASRRFQGPVYDLQPRRRAG